MAEGNGTDLGSVMMMLTNVLEGQELLRADVGEIKSDIGHFKTETKREFARVHLDMSQLRQDLALYHGSVMSHGMLITELQVRLARIEDHLKLPPMETH